MALSCVPTNHDTSTHWDEIDKMNNKGVEIIGALLIVNKTIYRQHGLKMSTREANDPVNPCKWIHRQTYSHLLIGLFF